MTEYSRENPSRRYVELLGYYRTMHEKGAEDQNLPPENTFNGQSLGKHAGTIGSIIATYNSKTILDYGSGKGAQYEPMNIKTPDGRKFPDIKTAWGVDTITCFDPGYQPFNRLPKGQFDGVVSTDVLEHCPREDIPWLLNEIFGFAKQFVYLNIACYPARKTLPNGENAHCTLEKPRVWIQLVGQSVKRFPKPKCWIAFDVIKADETGEQGIVTELFEWDHPGPEAAVEY